jgi:hypothetical protein
MFLRRTNRRKDGKDHRYFSVVENRRLSSGKTAQRTVLYLGEVNDRQQAAWRKTLEVFDEQQRRSRTLSLFPEDREIPEDAVDSLPVRLSGLELLRPRRFGNCWLACEIWRQLGLDDFWRRRLPDGREAVSWEKVLELLVVNQLLDPASEWRVHRQGFLSTAMDELLDVDYAVAEKDRLYRCLDRVLEHKQDLFVWLRGKWADLFQADFEVLLYDLTSTYFEGAMEENPKAKRGYSRDGRPAGLPPGGGGAGGDHRRLSVGLRSHGRQHHRLHHAARVPRQNREDLREGEADVGDGPGHPDRGDSGRDA